MICRSAAAGADASGPRRRLDRHGRSRRLFGHPALKELEIRQIRWHSELQVGPRQVPSRTESGGVGGHVSTADFAVDT